jgi:GT2 family glycosyltransferase
MAAEGDWTVSLDICVATMSEPNIEDNDSISTIITECPATRYPGDIGSFHRQSEGVHVHIQYNTAKSNYGIVGSYQRLYEETTADILLFLHDDVIGREIGWEKRVLAAFEDPEVGVCGFGGAKRHGDPSLYKVPYKLQHLGRGGYLSNVDDAEVHGTRFTGETDVAVLDGFALAIRRELLDRSNMWAFIKPHADFFCYDYAASAIARRYGYRTRLIGLRCHHRGGQTSVLNDVKDITSQEAYDKAHLWFYNEFRPEMPWSCE